MATQRVGFLGLGVMGKQMAQRLLKKGTEVVTTVEWTFPPRSKTKWTSQRLMSMMFALTKTISADTLFV